MKKQGGGLISQIASTFLYHRFFLLALSLLIVSTSNGAFTPDQNLLELVRTCQNLCGLSLELISQSNHNGGKIQIFGNQNKLFSDQNCLIRQQNFPMTGWTFLIRGNKPAQAARFCPMAHWKILLTEQKNHIKILNFPPFL